MRIVLQIILGIVLGSFSMLATQFINWLDRLVMGDVSFWLVPIGFSLIMALLTKRYLLFSVYVISYYVSFFSLLYLAFSDGFNPTWT